MRAASAAVDKPTTMGNERSTTTRMMGPGMAYLPFDSGLNAHASISTAPPNGSDEHGGMIMKV